MFNFFKPKLVQFGDGKFGIQKYSILDGTEYLWPDSFHYDWCPNPYKYDTEEAAIDSFLAAKCKVIAVLDDEWDL